MIDACITALMQGRLFERDIFSGEVLLRRTCSRCAARCSRRSEAGEGRTDGHHVHSAPAAPASAADDPEIGRSIRAVGILTNYHDLGAVSPRCSSTAPGRGLRP